MVFEIIRLRFHTEIYTKEDKYKSEHPIKEGASRHQRRQQGCSAIERRIMAMKNNSRDHNDQEENDSGKK